MRQNKRFPSGVPINHNIKNCLVKYLGEKKKIYTALKYYIIWWLLCWTVKKDSPGNYSSQKVNNKTTTNFLWVRMQFFDGENPTKPVIIRAILQGFHFFGLTKFHDFSRFLRKVVWNINMQTYWVSFEQKIDHFNYSPKLVRLPSY